MNNISDKDAIRKKFENWFDVQYGYLKNKKANADIIGITKEAYQAAYAERLSEFEQVGEVVIYNAGGSGEFRVVERLDSVTSGLQGIPNHTPLFTRKG